MERSIEILTRLRLGREEYCQRLLTQLILAADYPPWGSRMKPSPRGHEFLRAVDEMSFGPPARLESPTFVDEFDLPRRHDDERGGAPDYACLWGDRIWMIELKTEKASHRQGQLTGYFELAAHHHAQLSRDLTYLTPAMREAVPRVDEGSRFAHLTWEQVLPVAVQLWADGSAEEQENLTGLVAALDGIGTPWSEWRSHRLGGQAEPLARSEEGSDFPAESGGAGADPEGFGLAMARLTAADGQQRALDVEFGSLDALQSVRLSLRDAIQEQAESDDITLVMPWIWSAATSGGKALTRAGESTGYELRLSRSRVGLGSQDH